MAGKNKAALAGATGAASAGLYASAGYTPPAPPRLVQDGIGPPAATLIDLAKLPHIPLRSFVTVEGVAGVTGQNTRTITRGGPGMQGLEIDLLPTIAHIWVRLPPIPGQPSTKLRERLVPCANVSAEEPLR